MYSCERIVSIKQQEGDTAINVFSEFVKYVSIQLLLDNFDDVYSICRRQQCLNNEQNA